MRAVENDGVDVRGTASGAELYHSRDYLIRLVLLDRLFVFPLLLKEIAELVKIERLGLFSAQWAFLARFQVLVVGAFSVRTSPDRHNRGSRGNDGPGRISPPESGPGGIWIRESSAFVRWASRGLHDANVAIIPS